MNTNLQFPLKISLEGISPHSHAILEFFIKNSGHQYFSLTQDRALANVHIVDLDYPNSRQQWETNKLTLHKPCIALAIKQPTEKDVIWVAKPITAKSLIAAAQSIVDNSNDATPEQTLRQNTEPAKKPKQQESSTIKATDISEKEQPTKQPKTITRPKPAPKQQEPRKTPTEPECEINKRHPAFRNALQAQQRWTLLCGEDSNEITTYQPNNYFLGSLLAANNLSQRTKQVVQIKYEPHQFYVIHDDFLIFSPLIPSGKEFATLCQQEVKPGQINLHLLNTQESSAIIQKITTQKNNCNHLEYFIWTTNLLTSQGRIATTFKLKQTYCLNYWPDFTRIESFPYAMKIAAFWHNQNYTLHQIAEQMQIPLNYVIAFADTANSFNLLEKGKATKQIKPKKKLGIIARLFGKLTNSGIIK